MRRLQIRTIEMVRAARRLIASLTVKLVVTVGIFAALPIALYAQFESADRQTLDLVRAGLQDRSWLIAEALRPYLQGLDGPASATLDSELTKYMGDGNILKLMYQPVKPQGKASFYYVASAPRIDSAQIGPELDGLAKHGVLDRLSDTCSWGEPTEVRYGRPGAKDEMLTSVIPIRGRHGCWVLISTHPTSEFLNTAVGRPFWQAREVQIAALIYMVVAALGTLIAWSGWRSVRRFRTVAHEIRGGRAGQHSFAARNTVPELASVAADFDGLVHDLVGIARDIRRTAEDNAHSFKAPIATIQSSLDSLRRRYPADDAQGRRAIELIAASVGRLLALATAAQRLDNNTADLIEAPRGAVNLTRIVADTLLRFREISAERGVQIIRQLDEDVAVYARQGIFETIVENIVDNAIGFSPRGSAITVTLKRTPTRIDLTIEDEGPGIDPTKINGIFERYYSLRPRDSERSGGGEDPGDQAHAGLGLWIVKRNVEALGGTVSAANRFGGGLSVRIDLPADAG